MARVLAAPAVSLPAGVLRQGTYTATWAHAPGFTPATHVYAVQYRPAASAAWTTLNTTTPSVAIAGVLPGRTASIQVRVVGVNARPSPWSNIATTTRPVAAPGSPGVTATPSPGGVTSTASPVTCEAGTTAHYQYRDSVTNGGGWHSWSAARTAAHPGAEGQTVIVIWHARCVPGEGNPGLPGGEGSTSAVVPYTAPAAPSVTNSGPGLEGTSVTFYWPAAEGGWFMTADQWWNEKGRTDQRSITLPRAPGATCLQVAAARDWNAGQTYGVWSAYSNQSCATTTVPAPVVPAAPAVSSASYNRSVGLDAGLNSVRVTVGAVAGATQYQARYQWVDTNGPSAWLGTRGVSPGVTATIGACQSGYGVISSVAVQVRAGNSANQWSAWRSAGATEGARISGCA